MATETRQSSRITHDHEEIRRWAEERDAKPACVRGTGGRGDIGMLRLDFPGYTGEKSLQPISWDDWFEKFDERKLALLYQDTTASGEQSNFNKLVARDTAAQSRSSSRAKRSGGSSANKRASSKSTASRRASSTTRASKSTSRASASSGRTQRKRTAVKAKAGSSRAR